MEDTSATIRFIGIDAIFQYAGSGVQLFSGMIFYVVIVRLFTETSVGAIALFVAVIGLFNIIFTFGLNAAAQHFISFSLGQGDYSTVKNTIFKFIGIGAFISLIGFFGLLLMAPLLSNIFFHSASYTLLVRMLSIVLFGNIFYGILNGALLGMQNFRLSAFVNIIIWITYYGVSMLFAIFYRSLEAIIIGWIIGITVGVLAELVFIILSIKRYGGPGLNVPTYTFIFSYSFPILLSTLISYGAASVDRFIVSGILNLYALGVYNFSLLIATSISLLSSPFNNILMPKFSEMFAKGAKGVIRPTVIVSSTLLASIYVPAAMGIATLAPIILYLLGGISYLSGILPLRIIMVSTAVFVTQNVFVQAIASIRKTRLLFYSSITGLISNLLLSFLLIPTYGLVGASIGYSSVSASSFFLLYWFAKREGLALLDVVGIVKIWIAAILMFIIVDLISGILGIRSLFFPLYAMLGALIYLIIIRLLRVFKNDSKEFILSLFPKHFSKVTDILLFLLLH